jgi:hypothetical protein
MTASLCYLSKNTRHTTSGMALSGQTAGAAGNAMPGSPERHDVVSEYAVYMVVSLGKSAFRQT